MKKKKLMQVFIAIFVMGLAGCVNQPEKEVVPKISVPSGVDNYFKKNMEFESAGGEKLMIFSTNVDWSMQVTKTQNGIKWLNVTPSRGGSGANSVTFAAEENTTSDDRSVVVLFTAGDSIRSIIVNQKHLDALTLTSNRFEVPAEGGNVDIEVNSTMDFKVTIPEDYKSWIHQSSSHTRAMKSTKVSFTIDPSYEYTNREGRIYFSADNKEEVVNIYQTGGGKIVLSQNEYNLTGSEQEFSVDISSNFDFSLEMPNVDWLKENTSKTRGMSSHTLKFKVAENDDYNSRSAKIRVYDKNSSASEEIVVNQASKGAILKIATKEYNVGNEKQDLDIEVRSNFDYEVDFQGATWLRERTANTRGVSSRLLKLSIDENTDYGKRTARIKLYDKNSSVYEEIVVNQASKAPIISIAQKDYQISNEKQNLDIEVSSNFDYEVDFQGSTWLRKRTTNTRGVSNSVLRLAIDANTSYDERTARIKLYDKNSSTSETITITQKPKGGIEVAQKQFTIDELGGTITIEVKSNVDYNLTINANWITESSKTRGLTSHKHNLKVAALGADADREGTITIKNSALNYSETITIKQYNSLYFSKAKTNLLIGKETSLQLTNLTSQSVKWSSSNSSVATVDNNGKVKGISKGEATITAKTSDGKHIATCKVTVYDITYFINAYCSSFAGSMVNTLITNGSKLSWTVSNNSSETITLKSYQLVDGVSGKVVQSGNISGGDIGSGKSGTLPTTVGANGINMPVTCHLKYAYNGTEYTVTAKYEKSSWSF